MNFFQIIFCEGKSKRWRNIFLTGLALSIIGALVANFILPSIPVIGYGILDIGVVVTFCSMVFAFDE